MLNEIFILVSILLISYLFVHLGKKIKIPSVAILIVFGLLLSYNGLDVIFVGNNEHLIEFLGILGLFSLMFSAGLESSYKKLIEQEKDAFFIALFGALVPFLLGFLSFLVLGFGIITSLVVGICMSITAEATKAKLLFDIKKLKTRVGSTMLGAGLIDDLFGIIFFSIILFSVGSLDHSENFIFAGVLISFFIGLCSQNFIKERDMIRKIEKYLSRLFMPFFFISMGLGFDFESILVSLGYLFLIIIIAILGKILGAILAKKFTDFSLKQLYLIGWSMNSRGALELAFAVIAFNAGLINDFIYSSLVIMAIVTTIIFPFISEYMIKKDPSIMK